MRCLELLRERYPAVKTIVLTGPATIRQRWMPSLARGAVAFVQKTVHPADLAAVIRQALAGNVSLRGGDTGGPLTTHRPSGI